MTRPRAFAAQSRNAISFAPPQATQSEKVVRQLGEYMGVTSLACIGGGRVAADIEKLRAGVQVVVGTPGRIYDLLKRRALRVNSLFYVILDEADEVNLPHVLHA